MPTECAQIEALISALQDSEATPTEQALVQRHVSSCPACQGTVAVFGHNDQRLRHYLRATPVPPIGAPWRQAARRAAPTSAGRWRAALVSLATVLVLLLGATWLVQRQTQTNGRLASSGGQSAMREAATAQADQQPGRAKAGQGTTAVAAAPAVPPTGERAGATTAAGGALPPPPRSASPATSAAAAAGAPSPAAASVNPTQRYDLGVATTLTLCWPVCEPQPRPDELRAAVVQALDRDLARPAVTPPTGAGLLTLTFSLSDGRQVTLAYDQAAQLLRLPDNEGWVVAPPELAGALAGITPP